VTTTTTTSTTTTTTTTTTKDDKVLHCQIVSLYIRVMLSLIDSFFFLLLSFPHTVHSRSSTFFFLQKGSKQARNQLLLYTETDEDGDLIESNRIKSNPNPNPCYEVLHNRNTYHSTLHITAQHSTDGSKANQGKRRRRRRYWTLFERNISSVSLPTRRNDNAKSHHSHQS
jgi:hypothetical protein